MKRNKEERRALFSKIAKWGFLSLTLACYAVILVESAVPGVKSGQQSDNVANQVPDSIVDVGYDKENLIPLENFEVSLSPNKSQFYVGDSFKYSYTYEPENTSYKDISIKASPSDLVKINGIESSISCLKEGDLTITFKSSQDEKIVKTKKIEILPVLGESLSIGNDVELSIGDIYTLDVVITPSNTTHKEVEFSSSNPSIASISSSGIIKALAKGTSIIKASLKENPSISSSIQVTVNEIVNKTYPVSSISLPDDRSAYASETITLTGNFTPKATSDFSLNNLTLTASDSKLKLTKKSSSIASGTFSFSAKYDDSSLNEIKEISVKAKYLELEDEMVLTINPLKELTTSMISSSLKTSYSGKIVTFASYSSKAQYEKLTLKITYTSASGVNSKASSFKTNECLWEFPSSITKLSSSYKQAVIRPKNLSAPLENEEVKFYPNKNSSDCIVFKVSYSLTTDTTEITDIKPTSLKEGISLTTDTLFEEVLEAEILLSGETANSKILLDSGFNLEVKEGNDLLEVSNKDLLTLDKEGSATLRFSSTLDPSIYKDIQINILKKVEKARILYNGLEYEGEDIVLKKGDISSVIFLYGADNTFEDKIVSKFYQGDEYEYLFSSQGYLTYSKESNQLAAIGGTLGNKVTLTFKSTINPEVTSSIDVEVDYTAPDQNKFELTFETISYPNEPEEFNKPLEDYSKISIGTILKATGKVNEDASIQGGFYTSSNEEIISIDEDNGKLKALSSGKAIISFHSLDEPNLMISKEIQVVESTSPFSLNVDAFKALEFEELISSSGKAYGHAHLAYGKSYKIKLDTTSSSNEFNFVIADFEGNKAKEGIVSVNASGVVTTLSVGTTYLHIVYGNEDSLTQFEYVLKIEVIRDISSYWQRFTYLIRKALGHFGIFALSGFLSIFFIYFRYSKLWQRGLGLLASAASGFAVAYVSELVIQKNTEGRYGCWDDIWIDYEGYASGLALAVIIVSLLLVFLFVKKRIKERKALAKITPPSDNQKDDQELKNE